MFNTNNTMADKQPFSVRIFRLLFFIALACSIAWVIQTFLFQAAIVDGHSMDPSLANSERMFVDKVIYHFAKPKDGDIITLRYPLNPSERFVKRIIGVEGDVIEVRNNAEYRNGQLLNEPYILQDTKGDFFPVMVKRRTVFVMGDNRNNSNDSRAFGLVPLEDVIGRVDLVVWPLKKVHSF